MPTKNIEQIAEEYNSAYKKLPDVWLFAAVQGVLPAVLKRCIRRSRKKWKNAKSAFACKLPKIATRTI